MLSRSTVWVVVSVLVCMAVAQCAAADGSSKKMAAVITVEHQSPTRFMLVLGLTTKENCDASNTGGWFRSMEDPRETTTVPDSVYAVIPYDADRVIIVYGTEDGIDKFRTAIKMLDVEPKRIELATEYYLLSAEQAAQAKIDLGSKTPPDCPAAFIDAGDAVRTALQQKGIKPITSPHTVTINNEPCHITLTDSIPYEAKLAKPVSSGNVSCVTTTGKVMVDSSLDVTPRANADGTITLLIAAVAPLARADNASSTVQLTTHIRLGKGESAVICNKTTNERISLALLTPTVLNQ